MWHDHTVRGSGRLAQALGCMKGTHIFAAIAATCWGLLLLLGLDLAAGARERHVPGYPSAAQIWYYVYTPICMLAVVVALWLLARHKALNRFCLIAIALVLAALLPFLFGYTGGV